MKNTIRLSVFFPSFIMLLLAVIASLYDLAGLIALISKMNNWILTYFSDLFQISTLVMVVTCIAIFFSPLTKVKIGGHDAKPLLSPWYWGAVTICTTTSTGMLFWSTVEPLYHFHSPPVSLPIVAKSASAHTFALSTMYMHWSFTPFAIYSIPALAFALAYHNLNSRFSISSALLPLIGQRASHYLANSVDSIALFTLVAGMAASLGTGALILEGGVDKLLNTGTNAWTLAAVISLIMISFVLSSISGLKRGIARLSSLNAVIFIIIAVITIVLGPTAEIFTQSKAAIADYFTEFIPRSLSLNLQPEDSWRQNWPVFYWANWLAWAPVVALFLGKIAKGYSVRAFLLVNFVIPALFSMLWMTIFSGAILQMESSGEGFFYALLNENGPGAVIYGLLDQFSVSFILIPIFIFVAYLAYVTSADSNTEAMASLCLREDNINDRNRSKIAMKIIWGVTIAFVAWFMTYYSGIDGIRMLSNLGGLPALFVIITMNMALLVWLWKSFYRVNKAVPT